MIYSLTNWPALPPESSPYYSPVRVGICLEGRWYATLADPETFLEGKSLRQLVDALSYGGFLAVPNSLLPKLMDALEEEFTAQGCKPHLESSSIEKDKSLTKIQLL